MKLEAGKYYKTRDGRKVGPSEMREYWHVHIPWSGVTNGYREDGKWGCNESFGLSAHPLDLISEWPSEGPVRTVTRKEIVPGVYGNINVGDVVYGRVYAGIDRSYMDTDIIRHGTVQTPFTATELRAAAATLIEIADALEDK